MFRSGAVAAGLTRAGSGGARRARVGLLLAAVLWSLAGVFIKFLPLHPLAIVFYRSFFASLFFGFFARTTSFPRAATAVSMCSYTAAISAFVAANKLTTAANAIVLQYTAPIFVFLIVRFLLREAVSAASWLALLCGMLGVSLIFAGSAGEPDAPGVAMAVLSGALFAIYMVSQRFLTGVHAATLTFANNLACCVLLLPFVWRELAVAGDQAAILAVMGVVQLGIPYWLFARAVASITVQEASLIVLVEPVLNPVWVALAVGELPSAATAGGAALILGGLALRYWREKPPPGR
ncbi:MAG TPA: DMT family transporter [candidate division Zixibacteria bacterium]|nr:DMT family transporter [candidate division Zixibacteria bacterium]